MNGDFERRFGFRDDASSSVNVGRWRSGVVGTFEALAPNTGGGVDGLCGGDDFLGTRAGSIVRALFDARGESCIAFASDPEEVCGGLLLGRGRFPSRPGLNADGTSVTTPAPFGVDLLATSGTGGLVEGGAGAGEDVSGNKGELVLGPEPEIWGGFSRGKWLFGVDVFMSAGNEGGR